MAEEIEKSLIEDLIKTALDARKNSYSPYSNYKVGAALLCDDVINIYPGCNIENASYPCGICAERVALAKAVSDGHRKFKAIAVAGSSEEICTPCGMCGQALYEFAPDLTVICCGSKGNYEIHSLNELLAGGFGASSMQ